MSEDLSDRGSIEVFSPMIYEDSIHEAVKTLRNGWIGVGPKIREFEKKFSGYIGEKDCVAVNNGSSALHIALTILDLPRGSKVITSAISHISAINAISYAGCAPLLADVEPRTGNISVESVKKNIDKDVKAILCTHIGGYPCDLDELRDLADTKGIHLIEDCSHAIGATFHGKRIGRGGLCCFSFSFPKAITGIEGGAILTDDDAILEKARILRNMGIEDGRKYSEPSGTHMTEMSGFRYSWNDVMASIALKQMEHMEEDNRRREQIANKYLWCLDGSDGVQLPEYMSDRKSSYFFIPIFFERREALIKKLYEHGVNSRIYFPHYRGKCLPCIGGTLNSEWYGGHELTLPINVKITDSELDHVLDVIKKGW